LSERDIEHSTCQVVRAAHGFCVGSRAVEVLQADDKMEKFVRHHFVPTVSNDPKKGITFGASFFRHERHLRDLRRDQAICARTPGTGLPDRGIGTCGNFRFVEKDSGFDMLQAYFDDTGALAGLSIHNDTSGKCVSGTIPSCTKNFSEKVCP